MIIDDKNLTIQIEARDINYILPQYVRSFNYYMRGAEPVEFIFPMFTSIPHPTKPGVRIPIHWVGDMSGIAVSISHDGSNVEEITPEAEAKLDEKDKETKKLKEGLAKLAVNAKWKGTDTVNSSVNDIAIVSSTTDRAPRLPANPAPEGSALDGMQSRQNNIDTMQARRDLAEVKGSEDDEEKEKPFEKIVKKDSDGNVVVEE